MDADTAKRQQIRETISKPSRALRRLAAMLDEAGRPLVTNHDLWVHLVRLYENPTDEKLYLRRSEPEEADYHRFRRNLIEHGFARSDKDYPRRALRLLSLSDVPAEDAACLVDPTIYVSHLSAMQRWGLTDRRPDALMMTRPDRAGVIAALRGLVGDDEEAPSAARMVRVTHPPKVRKRPLQVLETKAAGGSVKARGSFARISTVGQTFLDTMQRPDLSGGMTHVLEVWETHAPTFLGEAISAVDEAGSGIAKSRAGYVLEERMGVQDQRVEAWKALGKRGGSRLLDPAKPFAPTYSEAWMLSLNA